MSTNNPPSRQRNARKRWEIANPGHTSWECRGCGRIEYGDVPPHRWYQLSRSSGDANLGPARLGVCCSVACLRRHVDGTISEQENATPLFRPSTRRGAA